jgi:hypothetical protein
MQKPSDRFIEAITQSHTMAGRLDVLDRGVVIASTAFGDRNAFVQGDGGVTHDGSAAVRRRCEFSLVDPEMSLTPLVAEDLFSPLAGHEVRVWRGIDYRDGSEPELFSQGIFGIAQSASTSDAKGLTISISGCDRGRALQRAKWTTPYYVQENQLYTAAIKALILDRLPTAELL